MSGLITINWLQKAAKQKSIYLLNTEPLTHAQEISLSRAWLGYMSWIRLVAAGNVDGVTALYSPQIKAFLPTTKGEMITDHPGAFNYQKGFTGSKPQGEYVGDVRAAISAQGEQAFFSGEYVFKNPDGTDIQAQHVFVFGKDDNGEFKIVFHHSAAQPLSTPLKGTEVKKLFMDKECVLVPILSKDRSFETIACQKGADIRGNVFSMISENRERKVLDTLFSKPPVQPGEVAPLL